MKEANVFNQQESRWIELAREGDLSAFNQLVLAYQDMAFRIARWMLEDEDSAEDIVQNVFLVAYRAIKSFRGNSLRGWLLTIIHNACVDELRRRARHPWLGLEPPNVDGEEMEENWLVDPCPLPEDEMMKREASERIDHLLQRLPERLREVVILIDLEALEYGEAAVILGVPLGTIKSRLGRARARLREFWFEPDQLDSRFCMCLSSSE